MADKLDQMSAEGFDQAVEKAFTDAEKDTYEYEGKTYAAHPAATLFPLLGEDDFDALVSSLRLNGMRTPIVLLGDQIVDGRNRFRAAKKAGVKIIFEQIDPKEDICKFVMDMNIHRRNLTPGRKVALASTLRRMAIRIEQMRREAMREQVRNSREKEAGPGGGPDAPAEGNSAEAGPAAAGQGAEDAAGAGSGTDGAPAADVVAEAAKAAEEKAPHALDNPSSLVSRKKAAEFAGVSPTSLKRFDKVVETAPELQEEIVEGKMSVSDAAVVSEENPELRRQVVEDVRQGRARTGAQAIEQRTGRAPKAHTRPKASGGGRGPQSGGAEGGVAGMPPLPTVDGGADGKAAASSGAAAPADSPAASGGGAPQRAPSPALSSLALSPALLLAGVRKLMPVIDFDPCSSAAAQQRVRAQRYFDREQDGCQKAWDGASYVFPPPKFAGRFASKLMGEMFAGRVPRALFLAPSDLADEDEALLLRSSKLTGIVYQLERTEFEVEDGKPVKAPSRMVLYVFGFERKELYDAFDPWGKVLIPAGR
ncbi:MAG: hypothetical protein F4Y14_16095 [Acidobacteria bacterium]|nr:hypothetical protein [Acidobacteriota bacterium]